MERLKELLPLWALLAVFATAFGALGTMSPEGTLRRKIYYVLVLACVLMALLPSVIVFVPSMRDSLSRLVSTPTQPVATQPPPTQPPPTQLPPTPPAATEPAPERPPSITLQPGDTFEPPPGWWWVCTGDFTVTREDGSLILLYDPGKEETGLILMIEPDATFVVTAPWGGYCESGPSSSKRPDTLQETKIAEMCASGCRPTPLACKSVDIVELDKHGNEQRDDRDCP